MNLVIPNLTVLSSLLQIPDAQMSGATMLASSFALGGLVVCLATSLLALWRARVVRRGVLRPHAFVELPSTSTRAADPRGSIDHALIDAAPVPLLVTSMDDGSVLYANALASAWIGGHLANPWREALEPPAYARLMRTFDECDEAQEIEVCWRRPHADPTWAVLSARRIRHGGVEAVLCSLSPVNQLKRLEARLALWSRVFEDSSEAVVITDARMRILSCNAALRRATGYSQDQLTGRRAESLLEHPLVAEQVCGFQAAMRRDGVWHGELMSRHIDGTAFPTWIGISEVRDAQRSLTNYILTLVDISERKQNEERITYLAHHDALTGLPNRPVFAERLRQAIARAEADHSRVAVLFMDLDRFKTINDTLGHPVGDALLQSVARRLSDSVRPCDTVARQGGDEFVILLPGLSSADEAAAIVERRLLQGLQEPHRLPNHELQVGCSIGVALYPDHGRDPDELMRRADLALYAAKHAGRGKAHFFTPSLDVAALEQHRIESDLRAAIKRGELELHFQPRVDARDGRLVSLEALLRWRHPEHGWVAPSRFITVAEESGLIGSIGLWVVRSVCCQLEAWKGTVLDGVAVSINLSVSQLCHAQLIEVLTEGLRRHGLRPQLIEVELTESALMHEAANHQLKALKSLGVDISIDDFGTGYSNLSYLAHLPVDTLKIDRSFVAPLCCQPSARPILDSIVSLGHTLGLTVVAEGIEDADTAQVIRASHCDQMQGFHVAKPMAPERLMAWVGMPRSGLFDSDRPLASTDDARVP